MNLHDSDVGPMDARDEPALREEEARHIAKRDNQAALEAEVKRLRAALVEAREMVLGWGVYASDYIQKKWDLKGDIDKLDKVLRETI